MKFMDLVRTFVLLFAIIDPFGNVPLFLAMTPNNTEPERRRMALRACIISGCVLILFGLFGRLVLRVFGIEVPAFQIAGGIVLLLFSLPMLTAVPGLRRIIPAEEMEGMAKHDISIVPLAIPLLAGPGAITAILVLTQDARPLQIAEVLISALVVLFLTWLMLIGSGAIAKKLGTTGLNVLTRIMGLITLVIAVQFVLNGIRTFFRL